MATEEGGDSEMSGHSPANYANAEYVSATLNIFVLQNDE